MNAVFSYLIQRLFSTFSASVPPQLRVNPLVITETDSVTLDCQTPSSVSVSQCHFYTSSGVNLRDSSCLLTLTGTELLTMSHQGSSADIKVTCFYTVKFGESDSPSPHSDTASITIHSEWLLLLILMCLECRQKKSCMVNLFSKETQWFTIKMPLIGECKAEMFLLLP